MSKIGKLCEENTKGISFITEIGKMVKNSKLCATHAKSIYFMIKRCKTA